MAEIALVFLIIYGVGFIFMFLAPLYYFFVVIFTFKYSSLALRVAAVTALLIILVNMLYYYNTQPMAQPAGLFYQGDGLTSLWQGVFYFFLPFVYLHITKGNSSLTVFIILFFISISLLNFRYYPQKAIVNRNYEVKQALIRGDLASASLQLDGECMNSDDIYQMYFINNELMNLLSESSIVYLIQCYNGRSSLFHHEFKQTGWNKKIINIFVSDQFYNNFSPESKLVFFEDINSFLLNDDSNKNDFDEYIKKIEFVVNKRPDFLKYLEFNERSFWWGIYIGNVRYVNYIEKYINKKSMLMTLSLDIVNHNDASAIEIIKKDPSLLVMEINKSLDKNSCFKLYDIPTDSNVLIFYRGSDYLISYILEHQLIDISKYECQSNVFNSVERKSNLQCISYLERYLEDNSEVTNKEHILQMVKDKITGCHHLPDKKTGSSD